MVFGELSPINRSGRSPTGIEGQPYGFVAGTFGTSSSHLCCHQEWHCWAFTCICVQHTAYYDSIALYSELEETVDVPLEHCPLSGILVAVFGTIDNITENLPSGTDLAAYPLTFCGTSSFALLCNQNFRTLALGSPSSQALYRKAIRG